jgi:hypothetical protein
MYRLRPWIQVVLYGHRIAFESELRLFALLYAGTNAGC